MDTIKIIKYLKVLLHVSEHKGSIITEPYTVLGYNYKNGSIVSVIYFIILIISTNYIFVHLLDNKVFIIDARCKHEDC